MLFHMTDEETRQRAGKAALAALDVAIKAMGEIPQNDDNYGLWANAVDGIQSAEGYLQTLVSRAEARLRGEVPKHCD